MTPQQRHHCMASIPSRNTKPEMVVRRFLHAHGLRYRIHVRRLPGTPDIVLRRYRTVIFVNGCFWHGHPCEAYRTPTTRTEFWSAKIARNQQRDLLQQAKLKRMGWHVIRIWECQLKPKVRQQTLQGLLHTLNHLLLVNYGAHPYTAAPDSPTPATLAAEEPMEYTTKKRVTD